MTDPSLPDFPDADAAGADALGGFDMGALLEQAMGMQQQLLEAQAEAAEAVVEGQAGGGAVSVRVTGGMVFESVTIAPAAVDPDDIELLQDLVLAALNDAMDQIGQLQEASMGGLDLGAMGGVLGLGDAVIDADDIDEIEIEIDVIDIDIEDAVLVDDDDDDEGEGDQGESGADDHP
jgi:DNA-binding YbaB/EbfC family protein